jgi:hypothetical protein
MGYTKNIYIGIASHVNGEYIDRGKIFKKPK